MAQTDYGLVKNYSIRDQTNTKLSLVIAFYLACVVNTYIVVKIASVN